jgi:hypothetical protein
MESDLSNLLLSSLIISFPSGCSCRAGGIILALVAPLTAGLHISPS